MTPSHWLLRSAARWPDRIALMRGTQTVATYGDFLDASLSAARALGESGVTRGDRVAIFLKNRTEYLELLYGIWFCGAVAVPINAKLHPKEVGWILSDSGARVVFCEDHSVASIAVMAPGGCSVLNVDDAEHRAPQQDMRFDPIENESDELAWLFYTSGTTGKPKGVMITFANIASMVLCYFADVDDVHIEDAALYAAPMSHGAGLYNFMHVIRGARHVVPDSGGFDPSEILDLGRSIGPVSMFAAPTMVRRLVDYAKQSGDDGTGLRTIVYAGGPMYEADILDAVEVMGDRFVQIYGQGECPMGITALPRADIADRTAPDWRARLNSVGRSQSAVAVRVVDRDGNACATGDVGEILVKGPTVMAGYWNNSAATEETIKDGWLWTGDMGRIDAEGYVTLQDRSKDVIITGGSNVYPREVEEVLLSHAGVREVAVVGRRHAEWGEEVVAFVVCDQTEPVQPAELDALCLERIARFKRPKRYFFVDGLPKNNYGKVLKTELRKQSG